MNKMALTKLNILFKNTVNLSLICQPKCGPVLPTLKCYCSSKPLNSATSSPGVAAYLSGLRAVDPHHQHRNVSTADSGLPEPPKRPLAPFIKFANEKREQVKKANPDIKFADLGKLLGQMWRDLSRDHRMDYAQDSGDVMAYKITYQKFVDSLTPEQKKLYEEQKEKTKQRRSKRKIKMLKMKLNAPKRPVPGYSMFCRDQMALLGPTESKIITDHSTRISALWKNLPEDKKKVYQDQGKAALEQYRRELAKWEQIMVLEGHPQLVRLRSRPKKPVEKPTKKTTGAKPSTKKTVAKPSEKKTLAKPSENKTVAKPSAKEIVAKSKEE